MYGYSGDWGDGIVERAKREADTQPIERDPELARRKLEALETDDEFRERLTYIAGGKQEPHVGARIDVARDGELDAIADEYGLRRLKGAEVAAYKAVKKAPAK